MAGDTLAASPDKARARVVAAQPQTVGAGTSVVLDCGGCAGIAGIHGAGGTLTYRECTPDGTPEVNAAAARAFTPGEVVSPVPWRWVLVAAATAAGRVCTV